MTHGGVVAGFSKPGQGGGCATIQAVVERDLDFQHGACDEFVVKDDRPAEYRRVLVEWKDLNQPRKGL